MDGAASLGCTKTGTFGTSGSFATSGTASSVALGDLDRDGRLDVVTVGGSGTVSLLMGKGDGRLAAKIDYAAGARPEVLVLGDVDGDGKLDIVAADGSAVDVLMGKGDGSFGTAATYATKDSSVAVALGDLNADGKPDIVTANSRSYGYKGTDDVLLGTGSGKFASHVDYDVGYNPQGVALGDVDGDGKLDIVVANTGQDGGWSTGVLLGKGNGTFAAEVEYDAGCGPVAVALGDVNGDRKLDIVIANSMCSTASAGVLLGQGDGTFARMVEFTLASDNVTSMVLIDVNGDGALDIVTADNLPSAVTVTFGKGDGTFLSGPNYSVNASAVALGDLNGNGSPDLVAVAGSVVNVLLGLCQ